MVAKIASSLGITGPKDPMPENTGRGATPAALNALRSSGTIQSDGPVANLLSNLQSGSLSAGSVLGAVTQAIIRATDDICNNDPAFRSRGSGNLRRRRPGIHDNCEMSAKARIERALGISLASLPEFALDLGANIAMAYKDKLQFTQFEGLINAAGEVLQLVRGAETDKAKALAQAASRFLNAPELNDYVDTRADLAMAITILDAAIVLGAFVIIDRIWERHQERDAIRQTMMESIPLVIMRSDLRTLNNIIDKIGVAAVLKAAPEAIYDILAYYRIPTGTDTSEYLALRDELISTLIRIDPNWEYDAEGRIDLGAFNEASDDAVKLLSLPLPGTTDETLFEDTYIRECRVAQHYQMQFPQVLARQMYPRLNI